MAKAQDLQKLKCSCRGPGGAGGAVYGLGLIGALIYFIQSATTFWMGVLGFLKALVWPASHHTANGMMEEHKLTRDLQTRPIRSVSI